MSPWVLRALRIPFREPGGWRWPLFRFGFLGFGLFWTLVSFATTFSEYRAHLAVLTENRCGLIEGLVENFRPMPPEGHADERFRVADVWFAYSDYGVTDAFNNTSSHGGPIRAGQTVRICYDPDTHAILRLAIRDYRGPMPKFDSIFDMTPVSRDTGADDFRPPWYSGAFVFLYFLDAIGLFVLYRPYLRMFFRLRSVAVSAPVNPSLLSGRETIKLKDTLLRWDEERGVFWLRGRGMNFFQFMLWAAELAVDVPRATVTCYRLRLSSGLAVIYGAFLLGAYGLFSHGMPPETAALLVGGFGIFAAFANVVVLRRRMGRFEDMVTDALPELSAARPS